MPDRKPEPTVRMSAMQASCLAALAAKSRPDGEMCLPFRIIESTTGLSRTDVKRSVRALARKGLAEFHQGLCNDDGYFAGAGYCISNAGKVAAGCVEDQTYVK